MHDTTTLAGRIAVEQSCADGRVIQRRTRTISAWSDLREDRERRFNWEDYDYRIKPAEPLRCWVAIVGNYIQGFTTKSEECSRTYFACSEVRQVIEITPEVEAALKSAGIL